MPLFFEKKDLREVESISGDRLDGDEAVKSILGYSFESPRGLVTIDAATRENIHNSYLLRVEKQNGRLVNSIIETFGQLPAVKPIKQ
jgi:hypothetical protein